METKEELNAQKEQLLEIIDSIYQLRKAIRNNGESFTDKSAPEFSGLRLKLENQIRKLDKL